MKTQSTLSKVFIKARNLLAVITLLSLLATQFSKAQESKWIIGSSLVDFSGSSPQISTSSLGPGNTTYPPSNSGFDGNGELLFYVKGNAVYNKNNTNVGNWSSGIPSNPNANQICVVNVPGTCNKFYIIGTSDYPVCIGCTNQLMYAEIEVNNTTINIGSVQFLAQTGNISFAISKLRKNKSRYLYAVSSHFGNVFKYIITKNNISVDPSFSYTANNSNNIPSEVELYEDPNNGSMKLTWGYRSGSPTGPIDPSCKISIVNLNNQGNIINGGGLFHLKNSIEGVNGLELMPANYLSIPQIKAL